MLVLMCIAPGCNQGQGVPFKTPHMPAGDALKLLKMHRARRHPPAPELAKEQALRVNTNTAEHHPPPASSLYTTMTDSVKLPAVPSIAAEDTHGLFTKSMPEGIRIKSSAEAATKPETRYSSAKPAANHKIPAQLELPKSATKAAKKARQRAAKYGP